MGALVEGNETYIRKFRVTSSERDILSLRLRVDRVLGSADLQPTGLPRSAVVCIRHLRVSGGVQFEQSDTRSVAACQAAVAKSIEQMVMRASRPALTVVPLDAPAVVFLERAELLACMASDWCDGLWLTRWWWQGLLRNDLASSVVKDAWKAAPEYVPAALAYLARKEKAADFVKLWSHTESLALLEDVVRSFALHELMPVVASLQNGNVGAEPIRSTSTPAWKRWVPESNATGLEVGQQLLLNICLLLRRVPAIVRSSDFALEIRNWYRHASATPASQLKYDVDARATAKSRVIARPDDKVDSPVEGLRISADDHDRDSNAPELSLQTSTRAHTNTQTTQPSESVNADSPQSLPGIEDHVAEKPAATEPTEVVLSLQQTHVEESSNTSLLGQPNGLNEDSSVNKETETLAAPETAPDNGLIEREQIETRCGGLFYLINLGLYLNLYGDFTSPAKPGIELNIWDFVALVGAELIGSDDDPIWPFLAKLAGRNADQAPGEGFVPADNWRIDPEWLTHLSSSDPWEWNSSDDRLRLLHPAGFLVIDVPLVGDDPARQLRAEIEKYESVLSHPVKLKRSSVAFVNTDSESVTHNASPAVRAWLARLMPYVRARLGAALDLGTEDELAPLVCRRFARVDATDTHVEVFFGLADLPLAIRLAGLDRDPGWVPAAGRFIAFHFD